MKLTLGIFSGAIKALHPKLVPDTAPWKDPLVATDKTKADWIEEIRQSKEAVLQTSLAHAKEVRDLNRQCEADKLLLKHATSSFRIGCSLVLLTMIREVLEPARYVLQYPNSWTFKIAQLTEYPWLLIAWFTIAALTILPLFVMMILNPKDRINTKVKDAGMVGLLMGTVGYGYMASAAIALNIPHLVDSYVGASALLSLAALWVASWSNNLALRKQAQYQREHRCEPVQ